MKKLLLSLLLTASMSGLYAQGLSAKEIIQKADDKNRGLTSRGGRFDIIPSIGYLEIL